ncbi:MULTISPECIES: signal peptidase I [unclassified Flavobacterium]|uniref:signal peptidase I n=1 Tax=unclassified Flavobacterium TaxID=196869 RepID=UPI001292998F|nr:MULTISPECIES: signal peptidase I [unclassified Flavobacterium]MQP53006.1 signal peptidase I [Flavobacterium sp. LMO9]MQP62827.1 signal peptidase I [Flavobacterium sp. LMO6]
MEISGWLIFMLLVQVIHGIGTWKLYVKAGRKAWEAFIPVYNGIVLMQIINRPKWWILLLFIPVINLFLFPIIWIETLRTFGKKSTADMVLGVVTLGLYITYVNYTQETIYHANRDLKAPNKTMDTLGSISFAVVVATLVHTYFIQPYTIPTSSLEKSLLVGDFLFVSKFHYGARTPMTPIAAPMVHDTLPVIKVKSYLEKPSLPYFRFPALQKIERNDIVVFNWPADTLYHMYKAADKRYEKPIDKKTNYVKRCTAIPGDKIEIKDGIIFINGKESILPERAKPQYMHKIYSKNGVSSPTLLENGSTEFTRKYITTIYNQNQAEALNPYVRGSIQNNDGTVTVFTEQKGIPNNVISNNNITITEVNDFEREANFTLENAENLRKKQIVDSVVRIIHKDVEKSIFPGNKDWNVDNLGPIYIPEAGKSIELNKETLPFYKKVIGEYEGNDLKVNGNEIRINGELATSYNFKQDYYWMMGDNRHNSLDSRYWGFVPADHIVGKPIFIWMSIDGINDGIKNWSIRWDRLFTTVSGKGQPQSYFQYFLITLAFYFGFDYFRKKKKKKEEA